MAIGKLHRVALHARDGGILGRDTDQVSYCPRSITLDLTSVMLLRQVATEQARPRQRS
eukprot:COSAG02_NODE_540_length_20599_cov_14.046339_13_plen_58_part_00